MKLMNNTNYTTRFNTNTNVTMRCLTERVNYSVKGQHLFSDVERGTTQSTGVLDDSFTKQHKDELVRLLAHILQRLRHQALALNNQLPPTNHSAKELLTSRGPATLPVRAGRRSGNLAPAYCGPTAPPPPILVRVGKTAMDLQLTTADYNYDTHPPCDGCNTSLGSTKSFSAPSGANFLKHPPRTLGRFTGLEGFSTVVHRARCWLAERRSGCHLCHPDVSYGERIHRSDGEQIARRGRYQSTGPFRVSAPSESTVGITRKCS
ncbi:hypothetical protein J6590_005312 [Homalodisca vitripennis]|nr:hypothetical protein J6590_005312 [Homalodisca vitripennis]